MNMRISKSAAIRMLRTLENADKTLSIFPDKARSYIGLVISELQLPALECWKKNVPTEREHLLSVIGTLQDYLSTRHWRWREKPEAVIQIDGRE